MYNTAFGKVRGDGKTIPTPEYTKACPVMATTEGTSSFESAKRNVTKRDVRMDIPEMKTMAGKLRKRGKETDQ